MAYSSKSGCSFTSRRRQFAGFINDLIAEANRDVPNFAAGMMEPSIKAASLSATLGFSAPPVELMGLERPDKHPLLEANPLYKSVVVFRVNSPRGMMSIDIDVGANEANRGIAKAPALLPFPSKPTMASMRQTLETWKRAVDRLAPEDIRLEEPELSAFDSCRSIQMHFFLTALQLAAQAPNSDAARRQREFNVYIKRPGVMDDFEKRLDESGCHFQLAAMLPAEPPDVNTGTSKGHQPAPNTPAEETISQPIAAKFMAQVLDIKPDEARIRKLIREGKLRSVNGRPLKTSLIDYLFTVMSKNRRQAEGNFGRRVADDGMCSCGKPAMPNRFPDKLRLCRDCRTTKWNPELDQLGTEP